MRKDLPRHELRRHCKEMLDDILGAASAGFVDMLFDALDSGKYHRNKQATRSPTAPKKQRREASSGCKKVRKSLSIAAFNA